MRITFISDTHGQHAALQLPPTDLIIHAGDISKRGNVEEVSDFLEWFAALKIPHKVFIGGNHDFLLERNTKLFDQLLPPGVHYLKHHEITIEGIKIWGSPVTPFFLNLAFNRTRGAKIRAYWERIPADADIVVTHGPPYGIGDRTVRGDLVGCEDLLEIVEQIQPRYHVFGHIHEAYGQWQKSDTTFINASVLNLNYQLVNAPVTIQW